MMLDKRWNWSNGLPLIIACVIIAFGFIVAALIFSNAVADRPMQGSFSGSFSSGSYTYPDVMSIDDLKSYLGIYPNSDESYIENNGDNIIDERPIQNDSPVYVDNYSETDNKLRMDLQNSILNGDWPKFPYVQLDGKLYFSKQAIDDWFTEISKQQLRIE